LEIDLQRENRLTLDYWVVPSFFFFCASNYRYLICRVTVSF